MAADRIKAGLVDAGAIKDPLVDVERYNLTEYDTAAHWRAPDIDDLQQSTLETRGGPRRQSAHR